MLEVQTMLGDFTADHPVMGANNTPERLCDLLDGETAEMRAELNNPAKLAAELADVVIFALSIANSYGFDMEVEIREKIALNMIRYPAAKFQEGEYPAIRKECKALEGPIIAEFYAD